MTETRLYTQEEWDSKVKEIEALRHTVEELKKIVADDAETIKRDSQFIAIVEALAHPLVGQAECKFQLVLQVEARKHPAVGSHTPLDHISSNKSLAMACGMSENTAADLRKKNVKVGAIEHRVEHGVVNIYGEDIPIDRADKRRGDMWNTRAYMSVKNTNPREFLEKQIMVSRLRSPNQIDAREAAKSRRTIEKVASSMKDTPCPVCGAKDSLHVHCHSCAWNDAHLEHGEEKPKKPKKTGRRLVETSGGGLNINLPPPDPDSPGVCKDEKMTRHNALKGLKGVHTNPPPAMDYKNFEDPGIDIAVNPDYYAERLADDEASRNNHV